MYHTIDTLKYFFIKKIIFIVHVNILKNNIHKFLEQLGY